jgi:hypothetical protein
LEARTALIRPEERRALGPAVHIDDREWLHCPPTPQLRAPTQS